MANNTDLKAAVQAVIKANGNNEITGDLMQQVLLSIISSFGTGSSFIGVATPETVPINSDANIIYLASEPGVYSNFNGYSFNNGGLVAFNNKTGSWVGIPVLSFETKVTKEGKKGVSQNGVFYERKAFTTTSAIGVGSHERLRDAIKEVRLKGDWYGKLFTISTFVYNTTTNILSIVISNPLTENELITPTNTRLVAQGSISSPSLTDDFVVKLDPHASSSLGISAEIVVNLSQWIPLGDQNIGIYTAGYTYYDRRINPSKIIDLNGGFVEISDVKGKIDILKHNSPTEKNNKLDATVKEIGLQGYDSSKYQILGSVHYSTTNTTNDTINVVIQQTDTPSEKPTSGSLKRIVRGSALIPSDRSNVRVELSLNEVSEPKVSGYIILDLTKYFVDNTGAAQLIDYASYNERGINKNSIKQINSDLEYALSDKLSVFRNNTTFVSNKYVESYIKENIRFYFRDEDVKNYKLSLSYLVWTTNGTTGVRQLTIQIRRTTNDTDLLSTGSIAYSFNFQFPAGEEIKGVKSQNIYGQNGFPYNGVCEINFDKIKYDTKFSISNPPTATYLTNGIDYDNMKYLADKYFLNLKIEQVAENNGVLSVKNLYDAVSQGLTGKFYVNTKLYESIDTSPTTIAHYRPVEQKDIRLIEDYKAFFYYNKAKLRLFAIDVFNNYYWASDYAIIKSLPLDEITKTPISSGDFDSGVDKFDILIGTDYRRLDGGFQVVWTNVLLSMDTIYEVGLTFDNELLITGVKANRKCLIFTKDKQTAIKQTNFAGAGLADYFQLGEGVNFVYSWSYSQYGNTVIISDYDSGVAGIRGTTGGQKCYVSQDGGTTFAKVFEGGDWGNIINASNITSFNKDSFHIHGCYFDPDYQRIYLCTGDGAVSYDNTSFFYSDDFGATWTHKRCNVLNTGANTQMVSFYGFKDSILLASDASNVNGVTRINKTGKADPLVHEIAYNELSGQLYYWGRNNWKFDSNSPLLMTFGKDAVYTNNTSYKSFVLATFDGHYFQKVWIDESGISWGTNHTVSDGKGNVFISMYSPATASEHLKTIILKIK